MLSLLQLGPVLFGGTGGIISYLHGHGLLAVTKDCTRNGSINHKLKIKDIQQLLSDIGEWSHY